MINVIYCLTKDHNLHYLFHIALGYLDFAAGVLKTYVTGKEDLPFGNASLTEKDSSLIKMLWKGMDPGLSLTIKYTKSYCDKIENKLTELRVGYEYDDYLSKQLNSGVTDQ